MTSKWSLLQLKLQLQSPQETIAQSQVFTTLTIWAASVDENSLFMA